MFLLKGYWVPHASDMTFFLEGHLGPHVSDVSFFLKGLKPLPKNNDHCMKKYYWARPGLVTANHPATKLYCAILDIAKIIVQKRIMAKSIIA